jgi:DNA invertase Pin-like site-specific DNA recombinase
MRVAIYCRVSTRDKGQDTTNQRLQLREHAARQGWTLVRIYEEEVSGRKGERDREAFRQMFADAAKHQWDCLLFWSLDRLTREGTFQTLKYLNRLTDLGITYCSLTEPYINSHGVFGDVVVSLLSCLALQETQRLGARTRAGLEKARLEGRIGGRPRVDVKQDEILRMHEGGKSLTVIAGELGIGKSTAHRLLQQAQFTQ